MTFQLYDYPGGKIYLDLDEGEYAALMLTGGYEPEFTERMVGYLKPGMTFVDVGAHVGYYSLWAAKLVGETGKVFAFEPSYGLQTLLNKALELNDYYWLHLLHGAAGASDTPHRFVAHNKSWGGRLSEGSTPSVATLVFPIDDPYLASWYHEPLVPDAIKIDAEGAELDVLRGAQQTLDRCKHLLMLIAIHPEYGVTYDMLREVLEPQGFVLERQTNGNQVVVTR